MDEERRRLEDALAEADLEVTIAKEVAEKYPHAPSAHERLRLAHEALDRVRRELAKVPGNGGPP